jgi:hypothetical protein
MFAWGSCGPRITPSSLRGPDALLNELKVRRDEGREALRELASERVEGVANLGGNRETGGNRDAEAAHLREPRTLAAEQIARPRVECHDAIVEGIDHLVGETALIRSHGFASFTARPRNSVG